PESYTHRIGRTGRAGRSGEAILFITPREKNLLKAIERSTRQPVTMMELPTVQAVNDVRVAKFKQEITETLAQGELEQFQGLIEDYEREFNIPAVEIAAALAKMARGNVPLLLDKKQQATTSWSDDRPARSDRFDRPERGDRFDRPERGERAERSFPKKERIVRQADAGMQTYRIEVGYQHGVKPGNIVGAIANEGGIDSKFIGRIEIYDDYSVLDLPDSLPAETIEHLRGIKVAGQQLRLNRDGGQDATPAAAAAPAPARVAPPAPARAAAPASSPAPARAAAPASAPAFAPAPKKAPSRVADDAPAFDADAPAKKKKDKPNKVTLPMSAFRIEVGSKHEATPANIVGAIANEAGLEAKFIGRIEIFDDHSMLELPEGMPDDIFKHLGKVWVGGQQLRISHAERMPPESFKPTPKKPAGAPAKGAKKPGKFK
ncbi:MAG: DbpA RNA binding domain-containing protein, partial [Pseudomonadota bacterium]